MDRKPDGCWEWVGSTSRDGYGGIRIKGRLYRTHRLAYELARESIPQSLQVCHTCDNRLCCNPEHLWLGTAIDNALDCIAKGRAHRNPRIGEKHVRAKLTTADVLVIRAAYATGTISTNELARQYAVSQALIWKIVHRVIWKHI
jgi:hypothetical protein